MELLSSITKINLSVNWEKLFELHSLEELLLQSRILYICFKTKEPFNEV